MKYPLGRGSLNPRKGHLKNQQHQQIHRITQSSHPSLAMPTTRNRQLAIVIAQLCFIFLHHHLQKRRRGARVACLKQHTRRNELTVLLFTIIMTMRPPRYGPCFWVDTCSSHWVNHVLGGSLLQDQEFSHTFRMTPGSFMELHRILGIFHLANWLTSSASHQKTRYPFSQCYST